MDACLLDQRLIGARPSSRPISLGDFNTIFCGEGGGVDAASCSACGCFRIIGASPSSTIGCICPGGTEGRGAESVTLSFGGVTVLAGGVLAGVVLGASSTGVCLWGVCGAV